MDSKAVVDAKTGGHYTVWFYLPTKEIKLYGGSGTAWNINTGIVALGAHKSFGAKLDLVYRVKVIHKGK